MNFLVFRIELLTQSYSCSSNDFNRNAIIHSNSIIGSIQFNTSLKLCDKMPKGGKCSFNATLQGKYPFLTRTKIECEVKCEKCGGIFSIANAGSGDVERHLKAKKHIDALSAEISSKSIKSFFPSTSKEGMPACEATWALVVTLYGRIWQKLFFSIRIRLNFFLLV